MINIGIIGCGKIAQVRHIPEYICNSNAHLYGFYDLNYQRAKELADKYSGKAYQSYEELLAEKSIDAVSVCTANNSHAKITIDALNAGKSVLCEKPMAITLEECIDMVNASKKNNKYLMIDQNQRLAPAHVKAKELIENDTIGRPITFRTSFGHGGPETWSVDPGSNVWFFDKKRAKLGAMADLGIHKTDLIQYLLSQKIIATTARLATLNKRYSNGEFIGVDDNAICIYEMSGGTIGTMTASWTYYGEEDNSTVIYGEKGILKIYDDPKHPLILISKDGTTQYFDTGAMQTNDNQTSTGIIDMWMDCLINHHEPSISGESVLDAMKAVFASVESSETNTRIIIK